MEWQNVEVFVTKLPLDAEYTPILEFLEGRGFEVQPGPGRVLTKPMDYRKLRETPQQLMADLRQVTGKVPDIELCRHRW